MKLVLVMHCIRSVIRIRFISPLEFLSTVLSTGRISKAELGMKFVISLLEIEVHIDPCFALRHAGFNASFLHIGRQITHVLILTRFFNI